MQLVKDWRIILHLDDAVEINYIFCQTKGLSIIHFGSLERVVLHDRRFQNLSRKKDFSQSTSLIKL